MKQDNSIMEEEIFRLQGDIKFLKKQFIALCELAQKVENNQFNINNSIISLIESLNDNINAINHYNQLKRVEMGKTKEKSEKEVKENG